MNLSAQSLTDEATRSTKPAFVAKGLSILLIEDDQATRRSLAEALTEEGYDVHCASNGLEAVVALGAAVEKPALMLLDLWMPMMDGFEFHAIQKSVADS
jgi:CheY-like chemotaxis protein